ncbi:MAG: tetratricopeptide repeat protein [Bacteroidota bacterium]
MPEIKWYVNNVKVTLGGCIIILCWLSLSLSIAQASVPDSLRVELSKAESVEAVKNVISDAIFFAYNDPDLALELSESIAQRSFKMSFFEQAAKAYDIMGVVLQNQGDYDSAYYYYNRALSIKKNLDIPRLLAESLNNFGVLNRRQGRYDSALSCYHQALDIAIKAGDSLLIGNYFNNIGLVHENKEEYTEAIEFHINSLKIREALGDSKGIAGSLNNIGIIYQRTGDHHEAISYFMRSLEVKKSLGNKSLLASAYTNLGISYYGLETYDQALSHFDQSLTLYKELGDLQGLSDVYDNLSQVAKEKGELNQAIDFQKRSLEQRKVLGNVDNIILSHSRISGLYQQIRDYELAKHHALKAYDLAEKSASAENIRISALQLSSIYETVGQFDQALKYHKTYTTQKDSLLNSDKLRSIAEVKEKYESEKKEAALVRQELEMQRQKAIIKSRSLERNLLIGLVFSIAVISLLLFVNYRTKLKIREQMVEQNKALERDRSKFFASISHEFRTPLTLISAPVAQLREKYSTQQETQWTLSLIQKNANRLLRLINQILDLSKLEVGKLALRISKSDLNARIKVTAATFESLARSKNIQFQRTFPEVKIETFFDPEKVDQIISNLLSNAFKFTPEGGSVKLNVIFSKGEVSFEVINTGSAISENDIQKIFTRFYQVDADAYSGGTGIGLALVKELSELHHGRVTASSNHLQTTFTVTIPTDDSFYEHDQKVNIRESDPDRVKDYVLPVGFKRDDTDTLERPLLLLVEDNNDLRAYVKSQLEGVYEVSEASNGNQALKLAIDEIPDLIITDLMMPEMDGEQLTEALRNEAKTQHIPVIMLTARLDSESKLNTIRKGADHYLNKPFEMDELAVRIKSLMLQRKRIKEYHQAQFLTNPKVEDIASSDNQFLQQVGDLLKDNFGSADFTVDEFARKMNMSRVQLHRKMKAIIGYSASDFIRQYRLKKAYEYLQGRKGSVSEIAYDVGFNNLSYFSKAFKEAYRVKPSELLQNAE